MESLPLTRSTEAIARALDKFPMPEDWNALQGGKPRVFRNPLKPKAPWIVLHVYDEHPDLAHRFISGSIVETIADQTTNISEYHLQRHNWSGVLVERIVALPSFMNRNVHGDRCDQRSAITNGGQYDKIQDQDTYTAYLRQLAYAQYQELEFKVTSEGQFVMQPLASIRQARPLD